MTPAAVELALEIRRGDRNAALRKPISYEVARSSAPRSKRISRSAASCWSIRDNRLVADTLEGEWNDKLRALAKAREEREHGRQKDQQVLDDAIRERLMAMTTDFGKLWADPGTPNRERKRLLAYIIEDVTLIKVPQEGITKIHVRFKGGKTETLTALNPKSSAQQVKTQPRIVELVDKLLDDHIYPEIADLLNEQGLRPGGSARPGRGDARFTALRVAYLVHRYGLRSRYDRLRDRGMLTRKEAAARLGIHEATLAELGGARYRHETRLQRARVPVRDRRAEPAGQTLQSMEPARRSGGGHQIQRRHQNLISVEGGAV